MMNAEPDLVAAKDAVKHFATAFGFLILGLITLIWNSARLTDGDFSDPRVIGGLHFLTLGWLSLSVFGVLRVFSGVSLGSKGFIPMLAKLVHYLWVLGSLIFPLGLIYEIPMLIIAGAVLLALAILLFTIHFIPAIWSAQPGVRKWYLSIAIASLWGTFLLGSLGALARANVSWANLPPGYFSAHLLFAVFGWMGSTAIGVGSVLVPMFAYSRGHSELPVKIALPVMSALPIFAVVGAYLEEPYLTIGWSLAGVGSALWILQVIFYLRARMSRKLDPGMWLAAGATVFLAIAWMMNFFSEGSVSFLGLVLVGWLVLFTLGIYHRVIPFLTWFLAMSEGTKKRFPSVEKLLDPQLARVTEVLALSGASMWGIALFLEIKIITYAGAILMLAAAVSAIFQLKTLRGKYE